MGSATLQGDEKAMEDLERESAAHSLDPRWQLIERIVQTEPFQKSTRLPGLLQYLARHTIHGDRHKLTEQAIGQAVFGKRHHYNPAEDSAVRVYVRQLRLKLHEYYHSPQVHEELTVSIPKGGYALEFTPASPAEPLQATPTIEPVAFPASGQRMNLQVLLAGSSILFLALSIFL